MTGWQTSGQAVVDYTEAGGMTGDRLTHWYWYGCYDNCTTYQTVTVLEDGTYSLTAYFCGGESNAAYLFARDFGGTEMRADIPVIDYGNWTPITIDNIQVTNGMMTIGVYTSGSVWLSMDSVRLVRTGD